MKRKAEAAAQEVSRWFKIFKLFLKTSKYGAIILVLGIVGFGALLVFAFQSDVEKLEIFPTQYTGDWQNGENAFQKELGEEAVLAEFSSENSATLFKAATEPVEQIQENQPEPESEISNQSGEVLGESKEENITFPENETAPEIVPQEINAEQPSPASEQEQVPEQEQIPELQDEAPSGETSSNYLEFLKQIGAAIGGEEVISLSESPETESPEIIEEIPAENIPSESEIKEDANELLNLIEQAEEMPSISEPNLIMHSLVFSGFESEKIGEINRAKLAFSWAAQKRETNEILLVEYKLSEGEWKTLFLVQLNIEEHSNFSNNGYWRKEIPEILSWEDMSSLEVRFTLQSIDSESQLPIYLDAVWLEIEYIKPENGEFLGVKNLKDEYDFELLSNKKDFKINDNLEFKFYIKKKQKRNILLNLISSEGTVNLKTEVLDNGNKVINEFNPQVQDQGNGEFAVVLNNKDFYQFKPGKYKLKIEIENSDGIFVGEQEFTWGVLAINTNKSIYLPNETAYLQMAALRDDGHTACDANLKLEILAPNGGAVNPGIQKSDKCGPNNVVDVPDYFVYYRVNDVGIYQMKLTNLDTGYEITDFFEVRESVLFEVERVGPTRIYPLANYEMTLKIKVNQDFIGETTEQVPDSFQILNPNVNIENCDNENSLKIENCKLKIITWQVDWKVGETHELKYEFDAPDISPYIYLLGPLKIGDPSASSGQVFQETRKWQIATDATTTKQFIISGTADDPSTSATEYSCLMGDGNSVWTATENARKGLIATAGKLSNFKVRVETAPGAGKSWTFAVRINGANSDLSVTISDTNTISSLDTDEVIVAAGDDTSISATPSGTPTAAEAVYWTVQFTPDTSGETILLSSSNGTTFTNNNYRGLVGNKANEATEFDAQIVFPTAGTLKKVYLELNVAPGAGYSKAVVVRKNGVDTSLVATVSDTNTTGNDTSNTVTIAAGDKVTYRQSTSGSPASSYEFFGIVFVPDTAGEYIAAAVTDDATNTSAVEYQHLTTGDSALTATENEVYNLAQATTVKAIYVNLSTAPGSGYTWTFTLRDDAADTSLAVSIADTNTSGNYATDVSIAADSVLDTMIDAQAGTATAATQISYLFYNAPTGNTAPTINEVSLNSKGAINLIENSQIDISASASVTDLDGCDDISGVKAIVYRYSTYTASCSNDPNNCYDQDQFNCVADGACSSNTQPYNCYASSSMQFFTDPTDAGSSFSADEWVVTVIASDSYWEDVSSNSYDDNDETDVEVNTLTALEITAGDPINYETVIVGQNTGAVNQTVTVKNTGNKGMDIMVYGTNLTGVCGTITVGNQQYASTSFAYNDYGETLLVTPGERYYNGAVGWIKPTSSTPITNNIYWGINVPEGTAVGVCSGTNTFSATSEQ